jgi:thiamine transport system substrate-binding protein
MICAPRPARSSSGIHIALASLALVALVAVGCSSSAGSSATSPTATSSGSSTRIGGTVRLLTDDAFALSKPVLAAFEARTGIKVQVVKAGDGVEVVNKAVLTKADPEGDVLYGIDNNTLGTAFSNGLFDAYTSPELSQVDSQVQLDSEHRVTPIDQANVCVDYDAAWFRAHHLAPPRSFADLASSRYKGLLVTEDPTSSTPGLAFLLATVAAKDRTGSRDWQTYWTALRRNGVDVVSDWTTAFYTAFSGGGGKGTRPIVVSYATDPAYAVINAKPQPSTSPIGVIPSTCYRQVEFAGVLHGTKHPQQARALVDFLLSVPVQSDVPLQMYVQPVNRQASVPALFTRFTARPAQPLLLPSAFVSAHRQAWLDEWTHLVAR